MAINKSDKTELLEKLNELLKKQSLFQQAINELQLEITQLKFEEPDADTGPVVKKEVRELSSKKPEKIEKTVPPKKAYKPKHTYEPGFWEKSGIGSEVEQFIGTNLINKIGMIVVIIGVGIGAKYAIDNNLISPLVRILLGYLVGVILTFLAIRLKKKFFNFSAVLFSGAMTVYYYITYAAYSYYGLYSNTVTFILMVLFTVLTVALALYYNRQVIAHFGLVGAYLVPFLVSDPDSSVVVLFTYMVIINSGILFISTKKRWKPLNYLAFIATWVIFSSWFSSKNNDNELGIALTFASLFFVNFYLVFLSYKLILKEKLKLDDIFYFLLNAGVFYFVGTIALIMSEIDTTYGGLFAATNAIIHGITAYLIYKSSEKSNLFYWTLGIVVAFVTITIGVQFTFEIASILWSLESALLFWIGRRKKINVFDYLAFALICITFICVVINWINISYNFYPEQIKVLYTPFFSIEFLISLAAILSFSFIYYISRKFIPEGKNIKGWLDIFNILFPVFFLIALFFSFYNEIDLFWNNIQINACYELNDAGIWVKTCEKLNQDIFSFKAIWLINYSILFSSILAIVNFKWMKNNVFNAFIFIISGLLILIFLTSGLESLSILRKSYLNTELTVNYDVNIFHLLIRYVACLFFALLFYSIYKFTIPLFTNKNLGKVFEIILSVSIIWMCSSELITWLSLYGSTEVYKHGLSILWGILSFILIGYGIWKKKKHLRITAIILFAGTLIKLFVYDLTNLDTIQKTIVFLSVGAILLVVSFMYNKYRDVIFGND
jgi:uncharacterized membrane protein